MSKEKEKKVVVKHKASKREKKDWFAAYGECETFSVNNVLEGLLLSLIHI